MLPLDKMCSVNIKIPSVYDLPGWCPECGKKSLYLNRYDRHVSYSCSHYAFPYSTEYVANCMECKARVSGTVEGNFQWPNKLKVNESLLKCCKEVCSKILEEAVQNFKNENDKGATALRLLSKEFSKEIEKYGG
jgi:hypothetical protein